MATISGYDSSSLSVLFSSLNNSKTGSSTTDLLGINYSDYATIRSGSYYKLMKAYYSTGASEEVSSIAADKTNTSTSKDDTKTIARIESAADDLKTSADALLENGTKSLFKEEAVTDELYKAVNKFVEDYNSVVDVAADSNTSNISGAAERMMNMTGYNEKMLEKVGITVDADNHLKIDEKTFKAADVDTVKGLFNERGGYGYQVSAQASMINYYAENEASKSNTYTSAGTYTYNYNSGALYSEGI
ncbi:MAG: hypothetical protein IJZ23_08050 [Roseburia sp.]|nr:hypothetical protein [Roseburia sp.]